MLPGCHSCQTAEIIIRKSGASVNPFFTLFEKFSFFVGFRYASPVFPRHKCGKKEKFKNPPEKTTQNVRRGSLVAEGQKKEKTLWIFRYFCAIVNTTGKGASASFHPCAGERGRRPLPALSETRNSPSSAPAASIGHAPLNRGADWQLRPAYSPAGVLPSPANLSTEREQSL